MGAGGRCHTAAVNRSDCSVQTEDHAGNIGSHEISLRFPIPRAQLSLPQAVMVGGQEVCRAGRAEAGVCRTAQPGAVPGCQPLPCPALMLPDRDAGTTAGMRQR